jgi:hypothetical protein
MRIDIHTVCALSTKETRPSDVLENKYDRAYITPFEDDVKQHPVFFTQHRSGYCNHICFDPSESKRSIDYKRKLIKAMCAQVESTGGTPAEESGLLQRTTQALARGKKAFSVLIGEGVSHPFVRKYRVRARSKEGHHVLDFEDDYQHEAVLRANTELSQGNLIRSQEMQSKGGILLQGAGVTTLSAETGEVVGHQEQKNVQVGDTTDPDDVPHGARGVQTQLHGTDWSVPAICVLPQGEHASEEDVAEEAAAMASDKGQTVPTGTSGMGSVVQ